MNLNFIHLWIILVICLTALFITGQTFGYIKDKRDQAIQQNMLDLGYTPMDISCAYNITQPACIVHAQKELSNDDATR